MRCVKARSLELCYRPAAARNANQRRVGRFAGPLRGIIGDVKIDDFAIRLAVVRQDVIIQSQAIFDLRLEQGGMPMPISDCRRKCYESAALRNDFRPVGDQSSLSARSRRSGAMKHRVASGDLPVLDLLHSSRTGCDGDTKDFKEMSA